MGKLVPFALVVVALCAWFTSGGDGDVRQRAVAPPVDVGVVETSSEGPARDESFAAIPFGSARMRARPTTWVVPEDRAELIVAVRRDGVLASGVGVVLDRPDELAMGAVEGLVRTNALGEARFAVRPMRTIRIDVAIDDRGSFVRSFVTSPRAGETRRVPLIAPSIDASRTRTITVVDERLRTPIVGASVRVTGEGWDRTRLVTDENGALRVPASTSVGLDVEAAEYQSRSISSGRVVDVLELRRESIVIGRLDLPESSSRFGRRRTRVWLSPSDDANSRIPAVRIPQGNGYRLALTDGPFDEEGNWSIERVEVPYGEPALDGLSVWARFDGETRRLAKGIRVVSGAIVEVDAQDGTWTSRAREPVSR